MIKYPPPYGPTYIRDGTYLHPFGEVTSSPFTVVNDKVYLLPILIPVEVYITQIGIYYQQASAVGITLMLGIYEYNRPENKSELTLLAKIASEVSDQSTSAQMTDLEEPVHLTPGPYYLAIHTDTAWIQVRTLQKKQGIPWTFDDHEGLSYFGFIRVTESYIANVLPDPLDMSSAVRSESTITPAIWIRTFIR